MLEFVSAHIQWNTISDLEPRRSYKALRDDFVLLSAMFLSNIDLREYALTVDAIWKQFLSGNKVSLASDGWTSMYKLSIMSVIPYYLDRNWALCEVQLALNEVDHQFFSHFES